MSYIAHLEAFIEQTRQNPEPIKSLHYVYQFNLDQEAPFQIRFDNGVVELLEGTPLEAVCTLSLSSANFIKLLHDELNTTMAFMMGSLKVEGRMGLALKLQEALKHYRK
ncbi:SCP2 sterol-binding domain-containing protein [Paenibacillus albiflavus]|uniref:SCP2 sterol-binding domain-containing protein n=1 Tax=Paenibacillus albiflavus TaxID=2545760 RepID=A0A4V2WNP3_9BACL|nr:SCP2 sterol-binding domain-containing protein [Paenibacillus albiflavus]TCZ76302.1 SCP2 sterol-binding domain-containing protein [Paenibacillus albiflavus]